jgi:hypothetical protein
MLEQVCCINILVCAARVGLCFEHGIGNTSHECICFLRKNKRWQTAINSAGKYLYLGSYNTQEEAVRGLLREEQ